MAEDTYRAITKCLCTNTWINYIKSQNWDTDEIYNGIEFDEEYMCDVENWMPTDQIHRLCKNISRKFPEENDLFYKMGLWAAENRTAGVVSESSILHAYANKIQLSKRFTNFVQKN